MDVVASRPYRLEHGREVGLATVLVLHIRALPDHGAVLFQEEAHERHEPLGRGLGELDTVLDEGLLLPPDMETDAIVVAPLQAEPPLRVDMPTEQEVQHDPDIRKEEEHGDPGKGDGRVPALDEDDSEDDGEVEDQEGRLEEVERQGERLVEQFGKEDGHGGLHVPSVTAAG